MDSDAALTLEDMLVRIGYAVDKSVARRLIVQGAVRVDGKQICTVGYELPLEPAQIITVEHLMKGAHPHGRN